MSRVDTRDIAGGLAIVAGGLASAWRSSQYEIGTMTQMGPGYFPLALSVIFALLGACIAVPALFRAGTGIAPDWKNLFFVLAAMIVFALSIQRLGIFIATVAAIAVVGLAGRITFPGSIALGIALSVLAWLIFILGLGMTIPAWPWSW